MRQKGREMRRKKKPGKNGRRKNMRRKNNEGKRRKKLRGRIEYLFPLTNKC